MAAAAANDDRYQYYDMNIHTCVFMYLSTSNEFYHLYNPHLIIIIYTKLISLILLIHSCKCPIQYVPHNILLCKCCMACSE